MSFDKIYASVVQDVIDNGVWDKDQVVRPKWSDGSPAYTKSLISKQMVLPGNTEAPVTTTKRLAWKSAIHELIWFYIKRTSDVSYLRENKVKIWEEWTREDGTIGKAYGYQLGKLITLQRSSIPGLITGSLGNQVHKLIDGLKNDPASRRHIISLWNIDDLWDMALYPCVWNSQWLVKEGKLHGIVQIRSNDLALGNPFNCFQYYALQRMLAQVVGLELGTLTFNINDAHVYERHIEPLKEQLSRESLKAPKLWLNPSIKNFDDFTIADFVLVDPELSDGELLVMTREEASQYSYYDYHPAIKMEVAI